MVKFELSDQAKATGEAEMYLDDSLTEEELLDAKREQQIVADMPRQRTEDMYRLGYLPVTPGSRFVR